MIMAFGKSSWELLKRQGKSSKHHDALTLWGKPWSLLSRRCTRQIIPWIYCWLLTVVFTLIRYWYQPIAQSSCGFNCNVHAVMSCVTWSCKKIQKLFIFCAIYMDKYSTCPINKVFAYSWRTVGQNYHYTMPRNNTIPPNYDVSYSGQLVILQEEAWVNLKLGVLNMKNFKHFDLW